MEGFKFDIPPEENLENTDNSELKMAAELAMEKTDVEAEKYNENNVEKSTIDTATTFEELNKAITESKGLQGSQEFFEPAKLEYIIDRVKSGELGIEYVTRSQGLRDKVQGLLQKDAAVENHPEPTIDHVPEPLKEPVPVEKSEILVEPNEKLKDTAKILTESSHEDIGREKIKERISNEEFGKSLTRFSDYVQEFEESLRRNYFNRISFNAETFKTLARDESIDVKKVIHAFDDLQTGLKKDFVPDGNEKPKDPHYFVMLRESMDSLQGVLIGMRREVDNGRLVQDRLKADELSETLTKVINATRRKMEAVQESELLLRRYSGR